MNYSINSISYDQCDPFIRPTIIAEIEVRPETNKDWCNIHELINSPSFTEMKQLESLFKSRPNLPNIKNVYFNPPATVVLWDDGTKTVVKCQDGDTYSKETGLALCVVKKAMGNDGKFNDIFHKWIPEEKTAIVPKGCGTCDFYHTEPWDYPCDSCRNDFSNWEPKK